MGEFDELFRKYRAFERYEKEKFLHDTPENQELAIRGFRRLTDRLGEIWSKYNEIQKRKGN